MNRTDNVTKLRAKSYHGDEGAIAEAAASGAIAGDDMPDMKREEVAAYIASMALELHKMAKSVGLTRLLPPLEEVCYASSAVSNR